METEHDDDELQMALALSLQEYNSSMQSPQNKPDAEQTTTGPSNQQPSPQSIPASKMKSPTAGAKAPSNAPTNGGNGSGSGSAAQKAAKRRGKKPPQFAPSEAEMDACFKELASNGRSYLTIPDIIETGSKLGLELDYEKVGAMLEYLTENRVGTDVLRTGGISLQDFREISRHFRVE